MPNPTLAALAAASDGLLMPSESDYPFEPFQWESSSPLTDLALLDALGLPPDTPVETRSLDAFFARLTPAADWMDDGQRAQAARFAELHNVIAERLCDVVVYRVGQIQIAALIVGQDASGATVGLRTTLIET